jgi:hypothetical protein
MSDPRTPHCQFCGEPVDPRSRFTWHRVIGWERPGRAGGSDVTLRERLGDELAHDHCVRLAKAKLSPYQETLL